MMSHSSLAHLPRLFRTVRHLQPSQVAWRVRYLVQRRLEAQAWFRVAHRISARIDCTHAAIGSPHQRILPSDAAQLHRYDSRLAELQAGQLTLLNQQRPFAGGDDWCLQGGRTSLRLWRHTLHYHGWLVDLAAGFAATRDDEYLRELRTWLVDWITICRLGEPGFAHYSWNSYAIAERLWSWREIAALVPDSFWRHAQLPRERFLQSAAAQAEYLSRHIEWDLRGNHLLKDAVGLAAAADFIGGHSAARWRNQAAEIALSQVNEQILADGMHFERSPMYHIQVLEDLLALQMVLPAEPVQSALHAACGRMAEPVLWLSHPDGRFPLFNDAAHDRVSSPADVLTRLRENGFAPTESKPEGLRHFAESGLVAWRGDPWTVFFDVGSVGPDYQPGHAHADTLTVEASYQGVPLIVDPGTYCYDDDERRKYDRSTNAHNTVCIDRMNSSEVWHIFRVGRRAKPLQVTAVDTNHGFQAAASHNGYDHLPGSPRHRRTLSVQDDGTFAIQDEITGTGTHHAEGGFLLAPDWNAIQTSTGWKLNHATKQLFVTIDADQPIQFTFDQRPWHPEFGREIFTTRLVWTADVSLPFRLKTTWHSAT